MNPKRREGKCKGKTNEQKTLFESGFQYSDKIGGSVSRWFDSIETKSKVCYENCFIEINFKVENALKWVSSNKEYFRISNNGTFIFNEIPKYPLNVKS